MSPVRAISSLPTNAGLKPCLRQRLLWPLALLFCWSAKPVAGETGVLLPSAKRAYLHELEQAFNSAYEQVSPAVVLVTKTPRWQPSAVELPYGHPRIQKGEVEPFPREFNHIGSGTIISADGYILSNYHVVEDADSILVTLSDQREFMAEVVGFDSLIDIALLKIPARDLPVVQLGNSDDLKIGDLVLAIGHPLGLGTTLTDGIISALGRQASVIPGKYRIESFIQTNAVINPGNSGGPLLDIDGNVVGINTAISTRTGFYIGYGLAVPINLARAAIDDIREHGRVIRSYLGVNMKAVSQHHIRSFDLPQERPQGVFLEGVLPGSPAVEAGLLVGDVIMRVDGLAVNRPNQIQTLIYNRDPGDELNVEIMRKSERLVFDVVLREREEDRLVARGRQRISRLGMTVTALDRENADALGFTDAVAAELGFDLSEQIVVVTEVAADGLAATKGIRIHDVITEVDQQPITSLEQFTHFVSKLEAGRSALFWFWRHDDGIDVRALRIDD